MSAEPSQIDALIARAWPAERALLRARVRGMQRRGGQGQGGGRIAAAIERDAGKSGELWQRRKAGARAIKIAYPPELPVAERRDEIAEIIRENQVVVLCGETGSGKTTQLPKICLELGLGVDRLIGHTQPRRIAARTVAARIAEELGVHVGGAVGTKIRFDDKTSDGTLVKLMTDGILLAETRSDRHLNAYGCLIIDEAHERSLNIDFLLGYLHQLLPRRRDLKVIITSATIDPQRFAEHFERGGVPAPIIEVSGRTYPVEMQYRPPDGAGEGEFSPFDNETPARVVRAVEEIVSAGYDGAGDVLVFLPGEREIRQTAKALRDRFGEQRGMEILPLYARLSTGDQQRVFRKHSGRRVVLATNVAETSLTVPGIRYVIDPGTARISRYSARSRVQGLPVEPISQASANQRAGRCGRTEPGVCFRLYAQEDFESREEFTAPEIMRTNLASVVLRMADLRLGRPEDFPFLEPPGGAHIRDGYQTLAELGALDDAGKLTELGRKLARLPIDPRVGRMILAAHDEGCLHDVLVIAAGLSAQDPRNRPHDQRDAADAAHARFAHERSDFLSLLAIWDFYHEQAGKLSRRKLERSMTQSFLSVRRLGEWREVYRQLRAQIVQMGLDPGHGHGDYDKVHRALMGGLITHVGKKGDKHEYEGVRGLRFSVHPGSGQFSGKPKWVMCAELVRTTRLYARTVARIDPAWIEEVAPELIKKSHNDAQWDEKTQRVMATEKVTLYGLEIVAKRRVHFGPIDPVKSRELFIHHALVGGELHQTPAVLRRNHELGDRVRTIESKARRGDLLADAQAQFAFYDARLPGDVFGGSSFARWLEKTERDDPRVLAMVESDLLIGEAGEVTPERFPDRYETLGSPLELEYKFDIGGEGDGVTVRVPVELLTQVRPERADRLVPGMLEAKIAGLVRTLPKRMRRQFDAELVGRELAAALSEGTRGLVQDLSAALSQRSGDRITPADFRPELLDEYLNMRFVVIDGDGNEVGSGRDLAALRAEFAPDITGDEGVGGAGGIADERFNRDDLTEWDFGDLPEQTTVERGGVSIACYPALVDIGQTAGLRVFETRERADEAMRGGLARLFVRHLGEEFRFQAQHMPGIGRLRLLYAPLGSPAELDADIMLAIADHAFVGASAVVRTRGAFLARVETGWNKIGVASGEIGALCEQVLSLRQHLMTRLDDKLPAAWAHAAGDMRAQLDRLVGPRFLATTPDRWRRCLPRYLKAIDRRLDKLRSGGPERDSALLREVARWQNAYAQRLGEHRAQGIVDPQLDELRWMIEEYRVSLFAQELGTAVKVSPQRLEKAWEKVRV